MLYGNRHVVRVFAFSDCDLQQTVVVLFPNYIIYGDIYSSESRLTFSRSCIKLDGSTLYGAKAPFSLLWAVTDILNIDAQWCEQVGCMSRLTFLG